MRVFIKKWGLAGLQEREPGELWVGVVRLSAESIPFGLPVQLEH